MNTEKLAQYLDNKLPLDKKAVSEFQQLVKDYPYFQTAHLFLLKTLFKNKDKSYDKQLQLSGCFITNKYKLYGFINQSQPVEENKKVVQKNKVEKTKDFRRNFKPTTKLPKQRSVEEGKETLPASKFRPKLSDEEADRLHLKNSNKKHSELVNDFFTNLTEKDILEPDYEDEVDEHQLQRDVLKSLNKGRTDLNKRLNVNYENELTKPAFKITREKTKQSVRESKIEQTNDINDVHKKLKTTSNTVTPKSDTSESVKSKPKETDSNQKKVPESSKMSDIFSKIQKIKKNIEQVESKEKSDIISLDEEVRTVALDKPQLVDKDVFKSSLETQAVENELSETHKDEQEKTVTENKLVENKLPETTKDKKEEIEVVKSEISKSEHKSDTEKEEKTLKDKPVKIKEEKKAVVVTKPKIAESDNKLSKEINKQSVETTQPEIKAEQKEKTLADKLKVEEPKLNQEKEQISDKEKSDKSDKLSESKTGTINKETSTTLEKKPDEEQKKSSETKELSAADRLLQRIAERKKKISIEKKEKEEQKELLKQKEAKAVDEIIKQSSEKKTNSTDSQDLPKDKSVKENLEEKKDNIEDKKEQVVEKNKEEVVESKVQEEEKSENNNSETKNNVDKVVVVDSDETEKLSDKAESKEQKPVELSNKLPKDKKNLIDSFLEKSESLERIGSKESKLKGDISIASTYESDDIMTETYAELLVQQKKYAKAKEVYEKLILKFPKKKTYFAIQIKKVESLK